MIYVVEDDGSIRELVVYTLAQTGYEARGVENAAAFWQAAAQACPRLVLLDIMLPDGDGLDILKTLRADAALQETPVIMITAKGSEFDKVQGFETGADDYLAKPFGMMELVARVRRLLYRTRAQEAGSRCGELSIDAERHEVTVRGAPVELTKKEFDLLAVLVRGRGRVMTRGQLLDAVWGEAYGGETRTLDVHIRTLRSKLGEAGEMIKTVRGVGYKLGDGA